MGRSVDARATIELVMIREHVPLHHRLHVALSALFKSHLRLGLNFHQEPRFNTPTVHEMF